MGQVKVVFDGAIVAEPELKNDGKVLEFPVYVKDQRKNQETGDYEDTGQTTKIRVGLWGDLKDEDVRYGDIVEVTGSLLEREYDKNDGSKGRALQTKFVDSIVVKWRKGGDEGGGSAASDLPW